MLLVASAVVAIRGEKGKRLAHSQLWYRDPNAVHNPAAGWEALGITVGCGLGLLMLRRVHPATTKGRDPMESAQALTQADAAADA
ncbi:hypothetical protein ACIBQ0_10110 [Nocardia nova]|uniref:hypothetical protein n=1 Tax=Nocardia nova TaxID=37330 RepID=UPI00378812CB